MIEKENQMLTEAYMYKILIVEDDSTITAVLKRTLEKWGYEAETISDFGRVGEEFIRCSPDLVLLDISLPFFDGYYWCQEFRKTSQVPIIFISSASDDMNLVMAVNMGADDFLSKPFKLEVVLAKIQALLRRTYTFGTRRDVLRAGDVILSLNDDNTLTVNMTRLRKKLEEIGLKDFIETKKGLGYLLSDKPE